MKPLFIKVYLFFILCLLSPIYSNAQVSNMLPKLDSIDMLLADMTLQIEITSGIDDLYNFRFERAESQFKWLKLYYPDHPLPYFLMGLSKWYRIVPEIQDKQYDKVFFAYMDTTIKKAEKLFKDDHKKNEGAFFLSAAYGFKARLEGERSNWGAATFASKKSVGYLEYSSGKQDLSVEFLFGEALYNYYAIWIRDNYKFLKPVLWFFDKGDKELGIKQLKQVVSDAFYTRVEAEIFLTKIYSSEGEYRKAINPITHLYETFPNNAYFHRYYIRTLYMLSKKNELETASLKALARLDNGQIGYGKTTGRYAAYYLGTIYFGKHEMEKAKQYFTTCIEFSEELKNQESGYYLLSLYYMATIANEEGNTLEAAKFYKKIKKNADRDWGYYDDANSFLKKNKKKIKKLEKSED